MRHNLIESVLGGVVLVVAAIFLVFAARVADLRTTEGYQVTAAFDRIDGVVPGTDVKLNGIKVGSVKEQYLDTETYLAVVTMSIDRSIKLPEDTVAEIASEGLLGGKYLSLIPGNEEEYIADGGRIYNTQAPADFIQMLGKFLFATVDKKE